MERKQVEQILTNVNITEVSENSFGVVWFICHDHQLIVEYKNEEQPVGVICFTKYKGRHPKPKFYKTERWLRKAIAPFER